MTELYTSFFVKQTGKAIGISEDLDFNNLIWLPKSQIEIDSEYGTLVKGEEIEIHIPDWLADEKGLI